MPRRLKVVPVVLVLAALAGCGSSSKDSSSSSQSATVAAPAAAKPGPEGPPIESGTVLGTQLPDTSGKTIDGIKCNSTEQVAQHVHAHLQIYVDGKPRQLPLGIGIHEAGVQQTPNGYFASGATSQSCFYWLHTHASDGIVHVESPKQTTFSLGQFFAVWGQPLTRTRVATAHGPVTAFVDGKKFVGDPKLIALSAHSSIELDVGTPLVTPKTATFGPNL